MSLLHLLQCSHTRDHLVRAPAHHGRRHVVCPETNDLHPLKCHFMGRTKSCDAEASNQVTNLCYIFQIFPLRYILDLNVFLTLVIDAFLWPIIFNIFPVYEVIDFIEVHIICIFQRDLGPFQSFCVYIYHYRCTCMYIFVNIIGSEM